MKFGIIATDDDDLWNGEKGVTDFFIKTFTGGCSNDEYIPIFAVTGKLPTNDEIDSFDGFLITGSHYSVNAGYEWQLKLIQFIRHVYYKGLKYGKIKMYGMCFGHQIIAKSLGGKVAANPEGDFFFGSCSVKLKEEFLNKPYVKQHFVEKNRTFKMIKFHGECVVELPLTATVIGSSSQCKYEMLLYKGFILTSQGHPEYTKNTMAETNKAIMKRIGKLPSVDINKYLSVLDEEDCYRLVEMVKSFLTARSSLDEQKTIGLEKCMTINEKEKPRYLKRQKRLSVDEVLHEVIGD